jgi:Phage integrase, N-terminal SAM-like domain
MGVQVKACKGTWWIFVNHKGHRKAKRVGTGKEGHRVAIAAAEKIQARLVLGDLSLLEEPRPQEITLQEYGHQWLTTDVTLRLKPATVEKYREVFRKQCLPELGKLPLSDITRDQVKTILQGKLMEGMKPNMARIMLTVLRACLYAAAEEGRLTGNPAARSLSLSGLDSAVHMGRFGVSQASHAPSHLRVDADPGRGKPRVRGRTTGALVHHYHSGHVRASHPRDE